MSVSQTANRIVKTAGNGVTTAFDFAWKIFANTDIDCYKVSAAGVYTLGVLTTDYTVSFDSDAETGTVTWVVAPVSGGFSVIIGDTPESQASTFPREGVTPAKTLENAIDKLTILVHELREKVERSALQPLTPVNPAAIEIDAPTDGKGLRWNLSGGVYHIENTTYDPDAAQADAAASAAIAVAAAALAQVTVTSGLASAKPSAPATNTWYYSTDTDQLELYITAAAHWFLIG